MCGNKQGPIQTDELLICPLSNEVQWPSKLQEAVLTQGPHWWSWLRQLGPRIKSKVMNESEKGTGRVWVGLKGGVGAEC